jgi:DNA-binding PucR family transcriptional regulator
MIDRGVAHATMHQRESDDARAREGVAAVASALATRLVAVAAEVRQVIESEIDVLRDDPRVKSMLDASVAENINAVVHALQHGVDTGGIEAPASALEYARRLAQRNVDAAALVRAYRLGEVHFTRLFLEQLIDQTGEGRVNGLTVLLALEQIYAYIDRITGEVLQAYERERLGWLQNRGAVLASRVRSILRGERVDIDRLQTALGYRFRQHHLGAVLWIDAAMTDGDSLATLGDASTAMARSIGCTDAPLFVPHDETSAWVWLPLGTTEPGVDPEQAFGGDEWPAPVAIALGEPAEGIEGFRRTHRQAFSAQAVALAAGAARARITPFADVAPVALMCADLDAAKAWVAETLGPLAGASERNEGLRETLRVFLHTGGSYSATGDQLYLHRNTVQYRVRQAETLRGRPIENDRLEVELALLACHWLGTAIVQTETTPATNKK